MRITEFSNNSARHEGVRRTGFARRYRVKRSVAYLGLAGLLVLVIGSVTNQAVAKSNFSIDNQSTNAVRVTVYDGGDSICSTKIKAVSVDSNKTENIQCPGEGEDRCKIMVEAEHGMNICKNINRKVCNNNNFRNIKDDQTLTITGGSGEYSCSVS